MIRKSFIIPVIVFSIAFLSLFRLQGQEVSTVDFRADVMTSIKVGDSTALCLVGHVVFFHNDAIITCDSAVRYSDRQMDCYRNVVVNKDSTFIYGDKADYNGLINEARIYSPLIKMVDKDATLYTYNFIFNTLTNVGRYYGGGTMTQKENLMESDEGFYYSNTRELLGVRRVEMRNPQYVISSDTVTYNLDSERATFNTRSYIWNDQDEFLTAQRGHYDNKAEQYTFTDSSYIMTKTQELWADTILYQQVIQDALMLNNVQISDNEQQAMAFGEYARYWGDKKQALLTRDPAVLNYETGEGADTLFMRSDTIFIYTVNRFLQDSVAHPTTPAVSDSVTLEDSPVTSTDSIARPQLEAIDMPQQEASALQPPSEGEPSDLDSLGSELPADSLPPRDSLSADSLKPLTPKEIKKQQEKQIRLEKEAIRKEKDAERAAKIKAKAQALRAKARAAELEFQQRELERERKDIARKYLKGKATTEDSLALLRIDSTAQALLLSDSLSASIDSTALVGTIPAKPTEAKADVGKDSTEVVPIDPADSLVRIVRGYYNVRIYRTDFQAVCDSIVGFSADSTIHMYTNPVLWNENNQITSQTVDLFTKNQTLERAVFRGEPLMCSLAEAPSRFNQVKGKEMTAFFDQGEIYKNDVNGNAQTYYYTEDGDSTDRYINGFLVAECADITFRFAKQELFEIVYRGNPVYQLYPIDDIPETQPEVMKGFKWEIDRRPTKAQVFNKVIRPSERSRYENLPKPTYPITGNIDQHRKALQSTGWVDRTDRYLSEEAIEFVRSLGN